MRGQEVEGEGIGEGEERTEGSESKSEKAEEGHGGRRDGLVCL